MNGSNAATRWAPVCGLVALAGCARLHGAEPARTADPTLGICAPERSPGAATGDALLAASEDALRRGCPREAVLDVIAARDAPDLHVPAPLIAWHLDEALQDAISTSLVGPGPLQMPMSERPDETWVKIYDPGSAEQRAPEIAAGVNSGAVPRAARDDGRLARLAARYTAALPCLPTGQLIDLNGQVFTAGAQTFEAMVGQHREAFASLDPIGQAASAAFELRWTCDLVSAARAYDQLADRYAAAGARDAALDARLTAWETRNIPGGVAGLLGLSAAPGEIQRNARERELAAYSRGLGYQAGAAAAASLDALVAGVALDAATEARVSWLRAVVALRLLGRPGDAAAHAARARQLAVRAGRADLLDGARLVGALAAAELDPPQAAQPLLADLFASLARRGALAARESAADQIRIVIEELRARGNDDRALALAMAARAGSPDLPVMAMSALHGYVPRILIDLGRLEDGLEAYESLAAALQVNPDRSQHRERVLATVETLTQGVRGKLHDRGASVSMAQRIPPEMARIIEGSFVAGDLAPLRAYLEGSDQEPLMIALMTPLICAARPHEVIAAARTMLDSEEAARKSLLSSADEAAAWQYTGMQALLPALGSFLMQCAARNHDGEMFRLGREMAGPAHVGPYGDFLEAILEGRLEDAATIVARLGDDAFVKRNGLGWIENANRASGLLSMLADAYLSAVPPRSSEALVLLEQSRALDLRARRTAQGTGRADPALEALTRTEQQLAAAGRRLRGLTALAGADRGAGAALAAAREEARLKVEALATRREAIARGLATTDPVAYRAAALAPPLSAGALQALLGEDETLVYYDVLDTQAWAIVVDRHAVRSVELAALDADRLPRLIPRLTAYDHVRRIVTADRGPSEVEDGAATPAVWAARRAELAALRAELYELLGRPLEPLIAAGQRLLIVPDVHTADLAFAELGPANRPWIARNPIRVLPGAYLLAAPTPQVDGAQPLVVGDPEFGDPRTASTRGYEGMLWKRLPGTRTEADAVAGMLGTHALLGEDATEQRVKQRMPGASIIHLATHGVADLQRPSSSLIVLALPHPGDAEDGFLHGYEIERMRLRARLVVLSACETGKGLAHGSEGILALDRSFLVAGAGAVVSSLWVVPDDATTALMEAFYQGLAGGRPADVALADAMQTIRRTAAWADPIHWAAFRLVGAGAR
jgi:CHAT domain-containing protein